MNLHEAIPMVSFPGKQIKVESPVDEPLVYLNDYFVCDSKYNHWCENENKPLDGSSPYIAVRETVARMLLDAAKLLPSGYQFKIYDAYRPIAVQQALWDYFRSDIAKNNPKKSNRQIDRLTEFFVSRPSYNILVPSLHNTGGAVDLSIIDTATNEIDMGCKFDDFTDKSWTYHFESMTNPDLTCKFIRENRRMLYNIMISVGFTNLPSEWWHYDFGDSKWAQLKRTKPVYAGILDAGLRDAVPYADMDNLKILDSHAVPILDNIS